MREGGDLSRYLVKSHHHESDTFGPREFEGSFSEITQPKGVLS